MQSPLDLNLGCPQEHARESHYGGYLLVKKDWSLVQSIGKHVPFYRSEHLHNK